MFRRYAVLLVGLLAVCRVTAQPPDDEYYPYAEVRDERTPVLQTDSALFFRAVQTPYDLYDKYTSFNLPNVALKRRGQGRAATVMAQGGPGLSYTAAAAMRQVGAAETSYAGIAPMQSISGGMGGIRTFDFQDYTPGPVSRASVGFTDRNYLVAAKFSATRPLGAGWLATVSMDARTGRDMYIEGVFTNALTAGLRLAREFAEGHALDFVVVIPPSVRGTRLSSVEEAFTLTGDKRYNPAWGFQNGKVRNSRVRRDFVPLAVASYKVPLSSSTALAATLGIEAGVRKYSMLEWYNAATPMPDNYRYLPSYTGDQQASEAWRADNPLYTQICWDELMAENRMAVDGKAVYALADRVERMFDVQADALFSTVVDRRLTLSYGASYSRSDTRNYKQMRDLLGAEYTIDLDQYLKDDDTYANMMQNDLRNPDRKIGKGDRFGYDYALAVREIAVRFAVEYRSDRLRADAAVSLGDAVVSRRGYYEKELFPGAQSYGRSRKMKFRPYSIKALAGWAFSPRSYIELALAAGAEMPYADALFCQPQYNNRAVDDPTTQKQYAAEIGYRHTGTKVRMQLTAYAAATYDGIETRRYYDDVAEAFCDMTVSEIGRMAYGLEAAADIRLSYRWALGLTAAAGRFKYIRDPKVTTLTDAGNNLVEEGSAAHMGGCRIGNAPQLAGCAELSYFGRGNWGLRLSAGYAGMRYVEPMAVRRTERIARQSGTTKEALERFVAQERLGDAFTADASAWKSLLFGESKLTFTLSVRNITGNSDMAYSGYESLRVRRIYAGDVAYYLPHATRYTYAGARSFYVSVSYRF